MKVGKLARAEASGGGGYMGAGVDMHSVPCALFKPGNGTIPNIFRLCLAVLWEKQTNPNIPIIYLRLI